MPEETAQKTQAAPPAERTTVLFGPAGLIVLFAVMIVEAIIVYMIAVVLQRSGGGTGAGVVETKHIVDLGEIQRTLSTAPPGQNRFRVGIRLIVNEEMGAPLELKSRLETNKGYLYGIASQFLYAAPEAELRDYQAVLLLQERLRQRLNQEYRHPETQEVLPVIKQVQFAIVELPG